MDERYELYEIAKKAYIEELEACGKVSSETHNRLCDAHTAAINNFSLQMKNRRVKNG